MTCLYINFDIIISFLRVSGEEKCIRTIIFQNNEVTIIKDLFSHIRISERMIQKKRADKDFIKTLIQDQDITIEIKTKT